MDLILGSNSIRRKNILNFFAVPFRQIVSNFTENDPIFGENPKEYCMKLAVGKGEALNRHHPESVILTADTIVYCNGKIYNKPADEEEAFSFLKAFSGGLVEVYTGVCVHKNKEVFADCERTDLWFNHLTDKQIRAYHQFLDFADKSGAFAIEGGGSLPIQKIDGCFYNVLGLPINTTKKLLLKVGIDLWEYLGPKEE